jgi:hypothetical protein
MTDAPRFKPFIGNPDEAHLDYHGGRFVDFVLRRADRQRAAQGVIGTMPRHRILNLRAILAPLRANALRSPLEATRNRSTP